MKLFKPKPRRRHRVAHRTADRWEPCEICGVVEMLRSENVSDDEVVGKAGEGLARVSIAFALCRERASFCTERRVGRHHGGCRVRVVVVEASEEGLQLNNLISEPKNVTFYNYFLNVRRPTPLVVSPAAPQARVAFSALYFPNPR